MTNDREQWIDAWFDRLFVQIVAKWLGRQKLMLMILTHIYKAFA